MRRRGQGLEQGEGGERAGIRDRALLGVTGYGQLDASYLHETRPVTEPGALSAFPLL